MTPTNIFIILSGVAGAAVGALFIQQPIHNEITIRLMIIDLTCFSSMIIGFITMCVGFFREFVMVNTEIHND